MAKISPLTIGFIKDHPVAAARALESMDTDAAVAFLGSLSKHRVGSILSHMNASAASLLVVQMAPGTGADALSEMDQHKAIAIMRLVAEKDRSALTKALPAKLRRNLKAALSFPVDTVGAKMTTAVSTTTPDQTVSNTLDKLRTMRRAKSRVVFVTEDSGQLYGAIKTSDLLQCKPTSLMGDVVDQSVIALSARARLAAVASLSAWDDYAQLPVVNNRKRLVGALSSKFVRQSSEALVDPSIEAANSSITISIATAFATTAIGLAKLLLGEGSPRLAAKDPDQRRTVRRSE